MTPAEALDQIRRALAQEGFAEVDGDAPTFQGDVQAGGRPIGLSLAFPCLRFTQLPVARLTRRDKDLPGVRVHVEGNDRLCYAAPGSLVLDMHQPGDNALTALSRIRDTLDGILGGGLAADLGRELPQHWQGGTVHVALPQEATEGQAFLLAIERLGAPPILILAREAEKAGGFDGGAMGRIAGQPLAKAWLCSTAKPLHLAEGTPLPGDYRAFLAWADGIDPELATRLDAAARHRFFKEPTYLFATAPNGCVGVRLIPPLLWERACTRPAFWKKMLSEQASAIKLERLTGKRMDAEFARTRNLAGIASLAGRRIVLVGCGTIGGHLACFLAQSGAGDRGGRLLLIDGDTLEAGNIGRHWLGHEHIGSNKALACAWELKQRFPYANVQGLGEDVMGRLDLLGRTDLLIDATGEEAVSRALNGEVLFRRPDGPAAVFAWLLGQGAAAQALFVPNQVDGRGCLLCCRPHGAAVAPLLPEANTAVIPAACGEAPFTPYGVDAPAIAAGLAVRVALEWAAGNARPSLRTVRVDHSATRPVPDADLAARPDCPACGRAAAP